MDDKISSINDQHFRRSNMYLHMFSEIIMKGGVIAPSCFVPTRYIELHDFTKQDFKVFDKFYCSLNVAMEQASLVIFHSARELIFSSAQCKKFWKFESFCSNANVYSYDKATKQLTVFSTPLLVDEKRSVIFTLSFKSNNKYSIDSYLYKYGGLENDGRVTLMELNTHDELLPKIFELCQTILRGIPSFRFDIRIN